MLEAQQRDVSPVYSL